MPAKSFSKIAILPFTLVLLISLACLAGTPEPPGEGEKTERGYAACQPIIKALDGYYQVNEDYPQSLSELIPQFFIDILDEVNNEPIVYEKTDSGFRLSFS